MTKTDLKWDSIRINISKVSDQSRDPNFWWSRDRVDGDKEGAGMGADSTPRQGDMPRQILI